MPFAIYNRDENVYLCYGDTFKVLVYETRREAQEVRDYAENDYAICGYEVVEYFGK
jgi:hypothetical protein